MGDRYGKFPVYGSALKGHIPPKITGKFPVPFKEKARLDSAFFFEYLTIYILTPKTKPYDTRMLY